MKYAGMFILGAVIGSFLNVCIYRIPRNKSIVFPPSHCPVCGKNIRWFDNIPLVSFLMLGGKCRDCKGRIPFRYFTVEMITAISGPVFLYFFHFSAQFAVLWMFFMALVVVTFIDIDHKIVPDVITIPGALLGLLAMSFLGVGKINFSLARAADSFFGILAGALSMYIMGSFGELLFKEKAAKAGGAVGGGDVKLMAMIGAFLGIKKTLVAFFVAPVLGSVFGIYILLSKKDEVIPYAPYLAAAAVISIFFGEKILNYFFPVI